MPLTEFYNSLKLKAITYRANRDTLRKSLSEHTQMNSDLIAKLESDRERKQTLSLSVEVMKQLIDKISQEQIQQLKELISYGLQVIFTDRNYSVDIVVHETKISKQASFYLIESLADGTVIRSEFKDAIGGGILSVVGLIIQVYYIIYYNLSHILFMDEALSQISTQYIPSVIEFITQLADKKNFKFILISHDQRLIEYGKKVYSVSGGKVKLEKVS